MAITYEDTEKQSAIALEEADSSSGCQKGTEGHEVQNFAFTYKTFLAMLGLQTGYMADVFIISTIVDQIAQFDAKVGPDIDYGWMVGAYCAVVAVLSPIVGRFADIFGKRYFLLVGNLIGLVGCIVGATTDSIKTLVAVSALLGLSGAMHQLAWAGIGELVPKNKRPTAVGIFQASLFPVTVFYPWIGSALMAYASWRAVYWLTFALNGFSLITVFLFYQPVYKFNVQEHGSPSQVFKGFDYTGSALWAIGLPLGGIGLVFGGARFRWLDAAALAPTFVGVAILVAFALSQVYARSEYTLCPPELMKRFREFSIVLLGLALWSITYYTTLNIWPSQIQILYSQSLNTIALYRTAFGLGLTASALVTGVVMGMLGKGKWIFTGSSVLLAVAIGVQAIIGPGTRAASTFLVCLTGASSGAILVSATAMIQLAVPHKHLAFAMGTAISLRTIGGAVSQNIDRVILAAKFPEELAKLVAPALAAAGVALEQLPVALGALMTGDVTNPAFAGATPEGLGLAGLALQQSYINSFQFVFLISIAFGGLAAVVAALSSDNRTQVSGEVEATLEDSTGFLPRDVQGLVR